MILIDVDGTLAGTDMRVHPSTWPAVDEARRAGLHLALCTGRPGYGDAAPLAARVAPGGYHVFQNGAVVATSDGRAGYTSELPHDDYRGIVAAARGEGRPLEVYTPRAVYLERDDALTRRHAEVIGIAPRLVADLDAVDEPIVRVQWVVPMDDLRHVQAVTARFAGLELNWAVHMDMPGVAFASVTRRGTSKVSAARWLAEHHGLTLEQTAMIGDGEGDLETIRAVGFGVAMGNATPAVKAAARAVVADVDEGGLAEAIRLIVTRATSVAS